MISIAIADFPQFCKEIVVVLVREIINYCLNGSPLTYEEFLKYNVYPWGKGCGKIIMHSSQERGNKNRGFKLISSCIH